ncbi:hydrophobin [Melanogaster broomeanus]|nr:hydrophobin [Melanogaster broomeanus]
MFFRASTLLVPIVALAAVATAAPNTLEARQSSECDTGSAECCNGTYSSDSATITSLVALLGIVLPDVSGLVGLGCTAIVGTAASCTQEPVCCTGNTDNGLINVGCTPINVAL